MKKLLRHTLNAKLILPLASIVGFGLLLTSAISGDSKAVSRGERIVEKDSLIHFLNEKIEHTYEAIDSLENILRIERERVSIESSQIENLKHVIFEMKNGAKDTVIVQIPKIIKDTASILRLEAKIKRQVDSLKKITIRDSIIMSKMLKISIQPAKPQPLY